MTVAVGWFWLSGDGLYTWGLPQSSRREDGLPSSGEVGKEEEGEQLAAGWVCSGVNRCVGIEALRVSQVAEKTSTGHSWVADRGTWEQAESSSFFPSLFSSGEDKIHCFSVRA